MAFTGTGSSQVMLSTARRCWRTESLVQRAACTEARLRGLHHRGARAVGKRNTEGQLPAAASACQEQCGKPIRLRNHRVVAVREFVVGPGRVFARRIGERSE